MSAEHELFHAYREWRRLVEAEGLAIQQHNWDLLADCHLAIRDFQDLVPRLMLAAREEWHRPGSDLAEKEKTVQRFVSELLVLTRRNQNLLQTARTNASQRLDELGETRRNLKKLHHSYGLALAVS